MLLHIGQVCPSGLDGKSSCSGLLEILRKWILWRDTDQGNESARLFFAAYTIAPVILWDSTRVWKILTAYVYTGAMVLGKSQRLISGKSISRTVPKGQQYITEGTHEAIVSREEFEKAQLVINNRNKVVMGSVDFPLKGKVRCGNCRRAMGYDYKQASPIFWCREGQELIGQTKCSSEIFQANDIENAVFQALKKELSLLGSLYGDIKKEEQSLKEASRKASRRKTSMEQELKNLKGEKMD